MASKQDADVLDRLEAFLRKRDGSDKALKVVRYAARLVVALSAPGSARRRRYDALQASVGTSRKAYRLGKFLQDVNGLRRLSQGPLLLLHPSPPQQALPAGAAGAGGGAGAAACGGGGVRVNWLAVLEAAALAGEGAYYFLDQFLWLMKAGFLPKKPHERRIAQASAWAETLGYAANILLSLHKLQRLQQQEAALRARLEASLKDDGGPLDGGLVKQLQLLRAARTLRLALIAQDLADSLTSINDITDGRYAGFNNPVVLSCAGLLSAAVSIHKLW